MSEHHCLISLTSRQIPVIFYSVPDLTGLIFRLVDFPSGCGGFADIFMGEWHRSRRFRQKIAIKVLRRHAPATLSDVSSQVSEKIHKVGIEREQPIPLRKSH